MHEQAIQGCLPQDCLHQHRKSGCMLPGIFLTKPLYQAEIFPPARSETLTRSSEMNRRGSGGSVRGGEYHTALTCTTSDTHQLLHLMVE